MTETNRSIFNENLATAEGSFNTDLNPAITDTFVVGTTSLEWNNGQFNNLTVRGTLTAGTIVETVANPLLQLAAGQLVDNTNTGIYCQNTATSFSGLIRDKTTQNWKVLNVLGTAPTPTSSLPAANGTLETSTLQCNAGATFGGAISASNLSGTNTGNVTLTAVGSSPNGDGASLSGQALTLQPANSANPGIITAGAQTIGGAKTFNGVTMVNNFLGSLSAPSGITTTTTGTAGTQLTMQYNELSFVSPGCSVVLPQISSLSAYTTCTIVNNGGNDVQVFTPSGSSDTIQGFSNALITNQTSMTFGTFFLNEWFIINSTATSAAFGSTPNTNGLNVSIDGHITLQPANGSNPGCISLSAQTLGSGNKTIAGNIIANNFPAGASVSGSNTGDVTLSSPNSTGTPNAATLTGQVLQLSPADASNPGIISAAATQTIPGAAKTFSGAIAASNLSGSNSGDITLAAVDSIPNANGASLSGQVLTLQPASGSFPGLVTTGAQTLAGNKTFSGTIVASNIASGASVSGTNSGDVTLSAPNSTGTPNAATLSAQVLQLSVCDASNPGIISTAATQTIPGAAKTFSGTIAASNLSGTNSGDLTLAAVGSAPSTNGASLSGQVLTLQPADATHPGLISTSAQTIAGPLTITNAIAASNLSGTNSGDLSLAAVGSSPNANAASLSTQTLTLQPASNSFPGLVSTTTQEFAGAKQFSGIVSLSSQATGLVAAGTNSQSAALALTAQLNHVGTVAAGAGVALPLVSTMAKSTTITVINQGSNDLSIWPANGASDIIIGVAINTPVLLSVGYTAQFVTLYAATWYVVSAANPNSAGFGSTPNAAGVTISPTGQIQLQPTDATHPGGISTTTQTIPGAKTFPALLTATGGITSTGTTALSLSGDATTTTVGIGNGAGAKTVTIGSTTAGSTLVLAGAGTSAISSTGIITTTNYISPLAGAFTAHAGGGAASATILTAQNIFVSTVATSGDSCCLPTLANLPGAGLGTCITILNLGANTTWIYPTQGGTGTINNLGTGVHVEIQPLKAVDAVAVFAGPTWSVYKLTFRIQSQSNTMQSVASSTSFSLVPFQADSGNPQTLNWLTSRATNTDFLPPTNGTYSLAFQVYFESQNTGGARAARIVDNNSGTVLGQQSVATVSSSELIGVQVTCVAYLTTASVIECSVAQDSGSSVNIGLSRASSFSALLIEP